MSYLVAGEEIAPSTGTKHYQGYLETHTKKSLGPLAKELELLWGSHPHLLISKGTAEQNKAYCLKENGPSTESGKPMQQGARTDLGEVIASIASGKTFKSLWQEHPQEMIKYHNGIKALYQATSPNLNKVINQKWTIQDFPLNPTVEIQEALNSKSIILWGKSGTGKTSYASALLPNALFVSHIDDLGKFDEGEHDGIIFDDMSFTHLPREAQIHLVDFDHPRSIHIRYQTANIPAGTKKIFTTNNPNGTIFLEGDDAINRRVQRFEIHQFEPVFNLLNLFP